MEFFFDQLDPTRFQRLINAILVNVYGDLVRLTPLRGKDGGRDGETAPENPFVVDDTNNRKRLVFQVKHHRMLDRPPTDARQVLIADFRRELGNCLKRQSNDQAVSFFLITNVPSSNDAITKIDRIRTELLRGTESFHADVWWQETVIARLDQMPSVWVSFPEMFAGGTVPQIAQIAHSESKGIARAIRLAIAKQYEKDKSVKFRQIELEKDLAKLFVDLNLDVQRLPEETQEKLYYDELDRTEQLVDIEQTNDFRQFTMTHVFRHSRQISALGLLLSKFKDKAIRKVIIEGGPGQGKSTITQMAAQIYRQQILGKNDLASEGRWAMPQKSRLPFRVELRRLAEWLSKNPEQSIEKYLTVVIEQDSGGNKLTVNDIQTVFENSPTLVMFDGLDEIGGDKLREDVLKAIMECISRLHELDSDFRIVVTTRPPALVGHREVLIDFERLSLTPMDVERINDYLARWIDVQVLDKSEKARIRESFERRRNEPHVGALAQNPMQLSVLLHFIRLKGEAFPDRRAELYRDYFQIVIDRDVEVSSELRANREVIQALHEFLGYRIHALTEVNQADRTLPRDKMLAMVEKWLQQRDHTPGMAKQFFKLGEERFGLIVASKGEGEDTRYGYSIQPIQEYFAAAFISHQISPESVHEVFETMIHRPYWREVALFLAGLRRPNEKADLIIRARNIDDDNSIGWYQDGRAIVLQLLQEGVFTEPRHVFSQALDFVLELLDAWKFKNQHEPPDFISSLDTVIRSGSERHAKRIVELLYKYNNCEDEYVMMRIHRIASRLLKTDDYLDAVMSYEGTNARLTAFIRLGWPCRWGADIEKISQHPLFWAGMPERFCASLWWRESFRSGTVSSLHAPASFHQYLLEQFALNPFEDYWFVSRGYRTLKVESKLAVWKMLIYQQLIRVMGSLDKTAYETFGFAHPSNSQIDFQGLEEPYRSLVQEIIESSSTLLDVFFTGDKQKKDLALKQHVYILKGGLQQSGLVGWIAYHCSYALIIGLMHAGTLSITRSGSELILEDVELVSLIHEMQQLAHCKESASRPSGEGVSDFVETLSGVPAERYYLRRFQTDSPNCIRLERGETPVPIVDIIAEAICGENEFPFDWPYSMTLDASMLRPLVERCRNKLSELLRYLGNNQFGFLPRGQYKHLMVQDTQRILKIARHTKEKSVLKGVAIVLPFTTFLRIAESDLILKLLQADSSAFLSTFLFTQHKLGFEKEVSDKESTAVRLIEEVADTVWNQPENFPFKTVCEAANFITEFRRIKLSPLLNVEDTLGMGFLGEVTQDPSN